jgi:ubiquinone/menaquinone biosynthesis C-methylase UbiE
VYALFDRYAGRYDLHTPPSHYQHDHEFVLKMAAAVSPPCRMLDVGCGTGVVLEKALRAGVHAEGVDSSPAMVAVAGARVGRSAVAVRRMQDIEDVAAYDLVVALSWTLNYCANLHELRDVLRRMYRALRQDGQVLLQVAHAPHVSDEAMEDREPGPTGKEDDVVFTYRFKRFGTDGLKMRAEYEYACKSLDEHVSEEHVLQATDARMVAQCVREAGFERVEIYDSWRRDPFMRSASPFVTGRKESTPA